MARLARGWAVLRRVRNWPTMILDHFRLLPSGPVQYRLRSGEMFHARAKTFDVNAIEEVWVLGIYTPPGFEIHSGDTVVDVGAHIGSFTIYAARHASAGRVFAFEPTDENYAQLTSNLTTNAVTNVVATRAAVSTTSGPRQMFMQADDHVGHSLYPDAAAGARQITVETTNLQDFFKRHGITHVDFLKLDCEGAEFEILLNASDALLATIEKISMEVHAGPSRDPLTLQQFLELKGYRVTRRAAQMYAMRTTPPASPITT